MKKQRKYLFTAVLFSLLLACEKDVDNTTPGNPQKKIEDYHQDFNRVFTSNNTENDKIWISDAQYYPDLYSSALELIYPSNRYPSEKTLTSFPFFVALNPKNNNNINIYLTVRHKQFQNESPKDEFDLLSNPNQYKISGTFKPSFSISQQSVLSLLRQKEIFDFDFDLYGYNKDSIHFKAIYEIRNKDIIFRSYDFNDNVKAFFAACQNLFDSGLYNHPGFDDTFFSSWTNQEVFMRVEDSKKSVLSSVNVSFNNILMQHFPNMIEPYYNKEKKVFVFKIRKEFQTTHTNLYSAFNIYAYYNIKYLVPVSATEDKMVLSGVGKKLDGQGSAINEDETYTITFQKI